MFIPRLFQDVWDLGLLSSDPSDLSAPQCIHSCSHRTKIQLGLPTGSHVLTERLGGQKWQSKWLVKDEVLEEKGEKAGAEGKMAEAEKLK